jgi:AcrR family transcriptional regulator
MLTSPDLRVRRTRRMLFEAVLTLAAEHDFTEITVRDITRQAEVNRTTFYLHFRDKDKDDLVTQALDSLFDEFTAEDRAFAAAHGHVLPGIVPPPSVDMFRHVAERLELYRRLLACTRSSAFAAQLRLFHERQFLLNWAEMGFRAIAGSPSPELRARFAATAVQGVIGWWLDTRTAESVETMAAWLWDLVSPLWFGSPVVSSEYRKRRIAGTKCGSFALANDPLSNGVALNRMTSLRLPELRPAC